ncbi:DUF5058 family protein [Mariniplasma anaerobium]|uniref:DUF5058 domain-containing protein n=1 Tax=Mariniplasma anaerobium TaxID=2735436 RepID=A0A7U9TJU1_9MOLU|nr:DUF5058 family protein [Mariniplasma anaerobium]BCR35502.1 DUF5058 domain-containing protein [Mariniplasma anaerobium]
MDFLNVWWVYLIVGIIFLYVLTQSTVFLLKARKRAIELEFTKEQIRKTITSSMIFSIAPSMAILFGLVILTKVFGPMVAGLRLGTLGALTYELPAATNVIKGVFGLNIGSASITPDMIVTALWVMTLGCIPPLLIVPLFLKKISKKFDQIKEKDSTWKNIMMDALFLGMISAFVGYVVAPITNEVTNETYISILAILVLLSSAGLIIIFGFIIKKYKQEWLKNYALPLSMMSSMALALLYALLGVR